MSVSGGREVLEKYCQPLKKKEKNQIKNSNINTKFL